MLDPKNLSPIGIGAWGLGGFAQRDPNNNDKKQINALVYSLRKGMNFIEVNFWNSGGGSVELIAHAIKNSKISRKKLFLFLVIYNHNLPTLSQVSEEINKYFKLFKTDYIDSLEFTMPCFKQYGYQETVSFINKFLKSRKARYTSLTNCSLEFIKKYHKDFKDNLFSHELHYSFEIRVHEENGIIPYCTKNNIISIPYQPLRRGRTEKRNWPLLVKLSEKYSKTQSQIILNWMGWKGLKPLVKSETISHIDENLASFGFTMKESDYNLIDRFRVPKYKVSEIDWLQEGNKGIMPHMLPNIFDETY